MHGSHRMDVAQDEITIGVPAYRDERELTLGDLLENAVSSDSPLEIAQRRTPVRD